MALLHLSIISLVDSDSGLNLGILPSKFLEICQNS